MASRDILSTPGAAGQELGWAREHTLAVVAHLGPADLERVPDPLMSPLVWDLAHIAAYEELWLAHRLGGLPLLHPERAAMCDAFETPRAVRGALALLDTPGAVDYLAEVRERSEAVLAGGVEPAGELLVELVLRHELQHTETMRQAMALGGLLPAGEPPVRSDWGTGPEAGPWATVDGGTAVIGAGPDGFAYDNERPRHSRIVPGFRIARRPVTNASWLTFSEGGGYVRREWWSDEGWAWKEEYDITHHAGVAAAPSEAPVSHVSWFEADAFARSCDTRLPTEHEWERASASNQLDVVGHVWEWTASPFAGYPGFTAHPYPEYSQVFFGPEYRGRARRFLGDAPARRLRHVPQLGPTAAPAAVRGLRLARDLEVV